MARDFGPLVTPPRTPVQLPPWFARRCLAYLSFLFDNLLVTLLSASPMLPCNFRCRSRRSGQSHRTCLIFLDHCRRTDRRLATVSLCKCGQEAFSPFLSVSEGTLGFLVGDQNAVESTWTVVCCRSNRNRHRCWTLSIPFPPRVDLASNQLLWTLKGTMNGFTEYNSHGKRL